MVEEDNSACRLFVCTTRMHTASSILLRTYTPRDPGQANHSVKIWQAARATSAAPPILDPITIEGCRLTLLDGAFWLNNPINETLSEASDVDPSGDSGCVISIGTGVANVPSLESSRFLVKVVQACVQISLDCKYVAAKFVNGPPGRQIHEDGRYFRFDVPWRLHAVRIDEWEKHEAVQEYVETYLETMSQQLDQCARTLLDASGYRVKPHHACSQPPGTGKMALYRTPAQESAAWLAETATVSHLSLSLLAVPPPPMSLSHPTRTLHPHPILQAASRGSPTEQHPSPPAGGTLFTHAALPPTPSPPLRHLLRQSPPQYSQRWMRDLAISHRSSTTLPLITSSSPLRS